MVKHIFWGVDLATGGLTLTAAVYIFNLKQFAPIIRPTALTVFLGYVFVVVAFFCSIWASHIGSGMR